MLRVLETMLRDSPPVPAAVRTLTALAQRHGIVVAQGQYSVAQPPLPGIEEAQLHFRFRATYPQTRAFVEAALARLPTLSVERISIIGDSGPDATPEVLVAMTLWRHGSAAHPAGGGQR
ncbi:MAG: hypothetical protein KIT17_00495 [Rubrivivax sp.]|nr:hypothetical protein [Rubrivivax sp.]